MTVKQVVQKYKLDKRHKWFAFYGEVVYFYRYTQQCTGCDGGGCHECGYHGKRISVCPVPAMDEKGNMLKTTDRDFARA